VPLPTRARMRFTTWLAPGLPEGLFDTIAAHVSRGLGCDYELSVESRSSGPISAADDRFAAGLTDVGFVCLPSYLWLTAQPQPSVALVPLAPVHDDPRTGGQPTYVSDLVVRADAAIETFADLEGARVGFNERASLSGFVSLVARLRDDGLDVDFFGELRQVGSHRRVLELIEAGELDAAAIDANVWRGWCRERPDRGRALRSVDVLGPFPVQPLVVRADLGADVVAAVAAQLESPALAAALRSFGVVGFGPIAHADYASFASVVDAAMSMVSC
jgi:phosphonate transport system substrate-binding protein